MALKINILYVTNTRIPSEQANTYQSFKVCAGLVNNGADILMLVPSRKNCKRYENLDAFQYYGIKNKFQLKKLWCFDFPMVRKINSRLYRLLHSVSFAFSVVTYVLSCNSKVVFFRDEQVLLMLSYLKRVGFIKNVRLFYESHKYEKKVVMAQNMLAGIVTINAYQKNLYINNGIPSRKIIVAHDGVDLDEYKSISQKKIFGKNILYVGSLHSWKGVRTLLDAMRYLNGYRLNIIGGPDEERARLRLYVNENNIEGITFTGHLARNKVLPYIEEADIFVLPNSSKDKKSFYTSPLKLFEYMAAQRVIVASALPSIREILQDNKNAVLYEPDNSYDLANKIRELRKMDIDQLINHAYEDVNCYTWDARGGRILDFIKMGS